MSNSHPATPPMPLQLNLDNMYGPVLVGWFLSCLFFGMTFVQTVVYFVAFAQDAIIVRLVVRLLFAFNINYKPIFPVGIDKPIHRCCSGYIRWWALYSNLGGLSNMFSGSIAYTPLIQHFGNPASLASLTWWVVPQVIRGYTAENNIGEPRHD